MRLEYKYLVPNELLDELRSSMLPSLTYDSFAEQRETKEYTVRSIYLDTPRMDYYSDKIEGFKIRKKLRIRGYNEFHGEKIVFLEIKRKYGPYNRKNRSPVLYGDLPELFETGNVEDLILTNLKTGNPLKDGKRFFYHYYGKFLKPAVLVTYNREPYYCKLNSRIRITLDKELRFLANPSIEDLYDETNLNYAMPKKFILEVKFDHAFPAWLQNTIKKFNLHRISISKYSTCLDAHHKMHPFDRSMNRAYLNNILKHENSQERIKKDAAGFSKYY